MEEEIEDARDFGLNAAAHTAENSRKAKSRMVYQSKWNIIGHFVKATHPEEYDNERRCAKIPMKTEVFQQFLGKHLMLLRKGEVVEVKLGDGIPWQKCLIKTAHNGEDTDKFTIQLESGDNVFEGARVPNVERRRFKTNKVLKPDSLGGFRSALKAEYEKAGICQSDDMVTMLVTFFKG